MDKIFSKIIEYHEKKDLVLCTIIASKGSAPRGKGAQMLCDEHGLLIGTIGGGPAEFAAIALSKEVLISRLSIKKEFNLIHSNQNEIDAVCGGNITVLFQFISADSPNWIDTASKVLLSFQEKTPGYLLLKENEATLSRTIGDDTFYSFQLPIKERLIIFGAGHISVSLAKLAALVDFSVTVFDNRKELLTEERFPGVENLMCGNYERIAETIDVQKEDYICVLTAGHASDFDVERQLLPIQNVYFGVVGSKAKTQAVNKKLVEAGIDEEFLQSVYTPIGLPIMAVTPEEIAVSIVAELIQVRAKDRAKRFDMIKSCPV